MKKIAFCCIPGLESFLSDIIKRLWEHPDFETRPCFSDNPTEITNTIQWADIVWLEWANEMAIQLTKHSTLLDNKHVILRLHSYEALSGYIGQIDWNRVNDIIFVCKHIQDLSIAQIAVGETLKKNPQVWIIPNGVDTNRFQFKERSKGPNIAYLGAINHKKGPMLLLHAFHALFTTSKKYHLHIAGQYQDPRYKFYFKKMIKSLGMENNVHEHGEISKPENWLEDMNYVINSSILEGHPVGIAEAMAMGIKPLVHSFVGSENLYPDEWIWHTIPDLKKMIKLKDYKSSEYYDHVIQNGWTLDNQIESILKIINGDADQQKFINNSGSLSDQSFQETTLEPLATGEEAQPIRTDVSTSDELPVSTSFPGKEPQTPSEETHTELMNITSSPVSTTPDQMAIEWIFKHTFHSESSDIQAINISTASLMPYPEVTGYLVPTLKQFGLEELSEHFLGYLINIQNKDGSFNAPGKDIPFAFDTAQVIRGFLTDPKNFEPQIRKACDWIISTSSDGRLLVPEDASWNMGTRGTVPEAVHIYALPPIKEAGEVLDIPEYVKFAEESLNYYLDSPDNFRWNNDNMLLHFYCYIIDGLISMYRIDEAKEMLDQLKKDTWFNKGISAYHNVGWVCSPGLAQAAICFHRIGDTDTAERILNFMIMLQNPSGGFFGSYGPDADYFPTTEISWANKFFLDAWHMIKVKNQQEKVQEMDAMKADGWEHVLNPDIQAIKERVESLESEKALPWLTVIADEIQDTFKEKEHTVLEFGSGTAEIAAYLAKNCYSHIGLLDNSQKLIDQGTQLFKSLDLPLDTYCLDLTQKVPIWDETYEIVFSSGLLEHFEDNDLQHIVNESARIASRKVIHLVPNSKCKPYVDGKCMQMETGTWKWGKERDFETLKPYFEKAGLVEIKEYSVAQEHALRFLPENTKTPVPEEGYLLVTVGYKKSSSKKESKYHVKNWEIADKKEWNTLADQSDDAWLYHTYEWQMLMKTAWKADVDSFGVYSGSDLIAIFSLNIIPTSQLLDSGFGHGGLAIHPEIDDIEREALFEFAIKHIKSIMVQRDVNLMRVILPMMTPNCEINHTTYLAHGFSDISTNTYIVDLTISENDLWQNIKSTFKNNIRNAEKKGVDIYTVSALSQMDAYHQLHVETYKRTGVKPHPKAYWEKLWEYFGINGRNRFTMATNSAGNTIASLNTAVYKKGVLYSTSASNKEAHKLEANKLLQWNAIKWAKKNGYTQYESGEAFPDAPKEDKRAGLTFFKGAFGGTLQKYYKAILQT